MKTSHKAFVETGFASWNNAPKRFQNHESGQLHRDSVIALASIAKPTIEQSLNTQKTKEMSIARTALEKTFGTVNLLARQGLAFRGHDTDDHSNVIQFLKARAEDSSELNYWMARSNKWLSHDIINEILELMANDIVKNKLKLIKSVRFFSIIMDETSDISKTEQVSVCVRIVLEDLTIQEIFLGFYATENTQSETLFKIVEDIFIRYGLNFSDLRGQCYDGASNMSGKITGLKTRVLEIEPRALYVHCAAHTLNLVVQDALESIDFVRNFIGIVKEIIYFIRHSPKRLAQFKNLQSDDSVNLTPYCPTR